MYVYLTVQGARKPIEIEAQVHYKPGKPSRDWFQPDDGDDFEVEKCFVVRGKKQREIEAGEYLQEHIYNAAVKQYKDDLYYRD